MMKSIKTAAWHNLMKKTTNALLEAGAIGLAPDSPCGGWVVFPWQEETFKARGRDIGFGQVAIEVWLADSEGQLGWGGPMATGWLERRGGAYLMESKGDPVFRGFSLERKKRMAEAKVEAQGYAPTGKFIF